MLRLLRAGTTLTRTTLTRTICPGVARAAAARGLAASSSSRSDTADVLTEQVKGQYESEAAIAFYKTVMGGGGGNIHYGIYPEASSGLPSTLSVAQSSQNAVEFLGDMIHWVRPMGPDTKMLDIGSGNGGAAHLNAQRYGCHVTGFNLGENQNKLAQEEAATLGISHLFSTIVGNFDERFPADLTGKFDVVWSEEALVHSTDKEAVLTQICGCLKPGGVLGFTDIMAGERSTAELLKNFTDRNATSTLARPSEYIVHLNKSGFDLVSYTDLSLHLPYFFQGMIDMIDTASSKLKETSGVQEEYMQNFKESLQKRIGDSQNGALAWGAFIARKPSGLPESTSHFSQVATEAFMARSTEAIATYEATGRADISDAPSAESASL